MSYGDAFPTAPVVLSQVQSANDPSWVKTRHGSVGTSSFQVGLEKDEASDASHGAEDVGWIAITPGSGTWSGHSFSAWRTANEVDHAWTPVSFPVALGSTPHFLAAMPSYFGSNNAGLRYRNLGST